MARRMTFPGDDLAALPSEEQPWTIDYRTMTATDEHCRIASALRVLAAYAVEAGDHRMAGRVLAAAALTGTGVQFVWGDCSNLFTTALPYDGSYESAERRGQDLDEQARAFFVRGVKGRHRRLLRAEARGILWTLRWLYRAGLLDQRELMHQENEPWRRREGLPSEAHPNIAGILVTPASMN